MKRKINPILCGFTVIALMICTYGTYEIRQMNYYLQLTEKKVEEKTYGENSLNEKNNTYHNFLSSVSMIKDEQISDEEKVKRIDDEMKEVVKLDDDMSFKTVSEKKLPEGVEVIRTTTPTEYADVLANVLQDNNNFMVKGDSDLEQLAAKQISKKNYMYTSVGLTCFNLSADIATFSDATVKASKLKLTITGVTFGKYLRNIEYVKKYANNNKKVKVQSNFIIQYYIATPFGDIKTVADGKNLLWWFSKDKGVHNHNFVG